jgi:hypothetical protein
MFKREKKQLADIKKFDDGTMEVSITFDPFTHGHDLGVARNYTPEDYKAMVESKSTQGRIANGYAVGYYSHSNRNPHKGYIPSERNGEGNEVIPCCKTLEMKWVNGKVRHTQRILANKIGKEIQKLIEGGVGGFSSVHNLKTKEFFGFDYVITPNFSSNRAIVDNVCEGGVCALDSITTEVESYLKLIGKDSIEVRDAIVALEYDSVVVDEIRNFIHLKDIELDEAKDEAKEWRNKYETLLDTIDVEFGISRDLEIKDWAKFINIDDIRARQLEEINKLPKKEKQKINWTALKGW